MTRGVRHLAVPSDGTFDKEEIPHATLRGVGSEDLGDPLETLPTFSPDLIRLPEPPVVDMSACDTIAQNVEGHQIDSGGIA